MGARGFFLCCLRGKLSDEATIVTLVAIAGSPLNFNRKQQGFASARAVNFFFERALNLLCI